MGLDVYVGSLTRYYAGQWKTIVQQWGEETGTPVTILRSKPEPADKIQDPAEIQAYILAWREALARKLEFAQALEWAENVVGPYFTDKPDHDCRNALVAWSAIAEYKRAHSRWFGRPRLPSEDLSKAALDIYRHKSRGSTLTAVIDATLWVPEDFAFPVNFVLQTGEAAVIASVVQLARALDRLNALTWQKPREEVIRWRAESEPLLTMDFETRARFGFSIFRNLAEEGIVHRLPIILDW